MKFVEDNPLAATAPIGQLIPEQRPNPTLFETVSASFARENDVVNAWNYLSRPTYEADPAFDILSAIEAEPLGERFGYQLAKAANADEFSAIRARIIEEEKSRAVSAASGWAGFFADAAAGLLSPTSFLPFVGTGTRGVRIAKAFGLAAAGVGAQEATLYSLQETRTGEEAMLNVGMGTILGGLLGSAAVVLSRGERELIESSMADLPDQSAILTRTEDGGMEEFTFAPAPEPRVMDTSFTREIKMVRAQGEDEFILGSRYLDAELPQGYRVAFVKADGDTAATTTGEYTITLRDPEGNVVEIPRDATQSQAAYWANLRKESTAIFRQDELRAAFAEGRLDEQIDDILRLAGKEPIFSGAQVQGGESLGAKAVKASVGRIKRLDTYVGGKVDRATDWAAVKAQQLEDALPPVAGKVAALPVKALNKTVKTLNDPIGVLARLNPLTRTLDNEYFQSARRFATELQIPNLKIEGEGAYPVGGDAVSRKNVVGAHMVKFLQKYDLALVEYYTGKTPKNFADSKILGVIAGRYKALPGAPAGKLPYEELRELAYDLHQTGKVSSDPAIMKIVQAQKEYYEAFHAVALEYYSIRKSIDGESARPMYGEMKFGEDGELVNYGHHILDEDLITARSADFIDAVTTFGERDLVNSFEKAWTSFQKQLGNAEALRDILAMDETSLTAAAQRWKENVKGIKLTWARELDEVKKLRKAMQAAGEETADITAAVKVLEETFPAQYALDMKEVRQSNKMVTVLNKVGAGLTEKQTRALTQIEELEAKQIDSLESLIGKGVKLKERLARIDDQAAKTDKQLERDYKSLKRWANGFVANEKEMSKLSEAGEVEQAAAALDKADTSLARFMNVLERIDKAESMDFAAMRELVDKGLQDAIERTQKLNARRAVRAEELAEKAAKADPEVRAKARAEELTKAIQAVDDMEEAFDSVWRNKGAEGNPLRGPNAVSFAARAQENAGTMWRNLVSHPMRVAGVQLLSEKRGPELARTFTLLPYEVKKQFLLRDPEQVIRAHSHALAPDLELYRITGSVNAESVLNSDTGLIKQDFDREVAKIKLLPAEKQDAALQNLKKAYDEVTDDVAVMVNRFRNNRGIPEKPNGLAARMGEVAMNLNVTRYMGGVVLSSLPDIARPVFRYGLTNTFKHAWLPMLTDFKYNGMLKEEAYRLNISTDAYTHNRASALLDTMQNYGNRRTFVEKGLRLLANKTGLVALFDLWTDVMKRTALSANFGELSHALRMVATKGNPEKEVQKAAELLRVAGIDTRLANKIWDQFMKTGGSTEFNYGFRLPNTEKWDDFEAVMAFAAANQRLTNDLIVTPALDRPSWIDANVAGKVVGQFRAFTFTSTTRIMMAGLQNPDMAFMQGAILSLAMGAVSYYTYAKAAGGEIEREAMELNTDKWVYEAVGRSGLLGVLSEGQRIGEQLPMFSDMAIFGGEEERQQRASSIMGAVFGPTYDLAERLSTIAQNIDDPTQSTVRQIRRIIPYQNVFYLRRLLDQMEENLNGAMDIPERRQ